MLQHTTFRWIEANLQSVKMNKSGQKVSSLGRALLLAAVFTLSACTKPEIAAKQEAPRPVRTLVVGEATAPASSLSILSLPGEIRPRIESRLGFRVGGKLLERRLNVGQSVKAGQIIAKLDPQDSAPGLAGAQAQLEGARTDLKIAQIELKRISDLLEKGFVSKAQLDRQQASTDAATARLHAAEAGLKQARNQVDFQTLLADVDGIVTGVEAEVGQVLAAGTPVYRVARRNEKELMVNVPETEFAAARGVSEWRVLVPALGRELQGKLREITPLADAASRTYSVRISLSGNLEGVEMGMTANALAKRESMNLAPGGNAVATANARGFDASNGSDAAKGSGVSSGKLIALPLGSIFSKDSQPGVWVVDSAGSVSLVRVVIAGMNEEQVFVRSGLSAGQKVVTAGANLLKPGQTVRIEGSAK